MTLRQFNTLIDQQTPYSPSAPKGRPVVAQRFAALNGSDSVEKRTATTKKAAPQRTRLSIERGTSADRLVLEQRHDVLRGGIGNRQRLDGQLLLGLKRRQLGRFFFHVGIDQTADAFFDGIRQL